MARANHNIHRTKRRKTDQTDSLNTEANSDDGRQSSSSPEESKTTRTMQQIEAHVDIIKHGQAYMQRVLSKLKLSPVLTADLQRVGGLSLDKECRILIIGETGAGKSRAITALLDEDRLLPTSGNGQACTAAPIEVHYNDDEKWPYVVEYKYMTCAELREDFDIVQSAFSDNGIDKEADAGPVTRFKTLYPDLTDHQLKTMTFEDVLASNGVKEMLGKSPKRWYNNKARFYTELSQTAATVINGSSTWALLDMVRLYVKHPLLENGLVLVDVPGVGDDNATRNERATKYIQDCSAVCIMAPCIRAVSNSTFRGLIKRALRQVQFSDRLACTILVCTKADDVDLGEVSLSLNPEGVEELTTQIQDEEEYRREIRKQIEVETTQFNNKTAEAVRYRRDASRWKGARTRAIKKGKTTIDPPKALLCSVPTMTQRTSKYYGVDEVDTMLEQIQDAKQGLEADLKKLEKSLLRLKAEAGDLDTNIKRMTFDWNRKTVRNRAEYIKVHQREAYIKEVQAHDAEALKAAQDISAEMASQSTASPDYATMKSQVPVFVVSAKAYQGHLGFPEGSAAMAVIESKQDTEIPALQSHLSSIAMTARNEHLKNLHLKVDTVLATLTQTLNESTLTEAGDLAKAKLAIDEFLTILSQKPAAFEDCATVALRSIRSAYKSQFTDMMAPILANIIKKALAKMNRFAATPDKNNPAKTKGLYYSEYKAALRKKGQHNGSRVTINFNTTLADAFKYSIETLLKRLFTTENKSAGVAEQSAKDLLNRCHDGMKDVFNELHTDFKVRAIEAQIP